MDKPLAPIALFAYTRLDHLKQTVEALQKNELAEQTELYVFSDAPKKQKDKQAVQSVRNFVQTITGFKKVIVKQAETNLGLAKSIVSGVTLLMNQYGKAIVLEDDLITTPNFLKYMNAALNYYESMPKVWSVAGCNWPFEVPKSYLHDVYFFPRTSSWGWATWKDRWNKVTWDLTGNEEILHNKTLQKKLNTGGDDMYPLLEQMLYGEVDSWAIIWEYYEMLNEALTVWPIKSKINNIGLDGSGEHGDNKIIAFEMDDAKNQIQFIDEIEINRVINKNRLTYTNGKWFKRLKITIKRFIINAKKRKQRARSARCEK